MDWDRVRWENLNARRNADFVEPRISRPLANVFSGVEGGQTERLKLLEKEREQTRQQLKAAQKAKQREKQVPLRKRARIKAAHHQGEGLIPPGTTLIKSVPPNLHQTGSPALGSKRKKTANLHPASSTIRTGLNRADKVSTNVSKPPSPVKISLLLSLAQKLLDAIQKGDMENVASLASKIFGESA